MRWFAFITVIILAASCKSLKPVVTKQPDNNNTAFQRSSSPQFIENITIDPSSSKTNVKKPAADGRTGGNLVTIDTDNNVEKANSLQLKYSILIDVPVEELQNLKLLQYIEDWYGTRYHFGGSTKQGIDCSAFSGGLLAAVFGIGLPRMAKDQYTACQRIPKDELQEGDLVFFHTTRKGVSHVGVYLTNSKFVHASANNGVVISDLNEPYYSKTFVAAGRAKQATTGSDN